MVRSTLIGVSLLAIALAGCVTAPASPGAMGSQPTGLVAAMGASSILAAGTTLHAPSATTTAEDEAAARAGASAETWTDPSLLSPLDDLAGHAPAGLTTPLSALGIHIPIVRFDEVNSTLYRGGLPSEDNLVALKAAGIKTDIDLMGEVPIYDTFLVWREKHWAAKAGLKFEQIIVPTGQVPFEKKISNAQAIAFLKLVLDPANQPCFVHCIHGRDRTGTMCAVYHMVVDHYTNAAALADMVNHDFVPRQIPALTNYVLAFNPADVTPYIPAVPTPPGQ